MGQLPDILGICLSAVKPGGVFIAYQGENSQRANAEPEKYQAHFTQETVYTLPADTRMRYLVCFTKDGK